MTRSIFGKPIGLPVEDAHGADYLVYHDRQHGEASALRPRMHPGYPHSGLLRLTTISNRAARKDGAVEKTVIWEGCSDEVRTDLANKFGLTAPKPCESDDIEDPRNGVAQGKPSDFVETLNSFRARLGSPVFTDGQKALLTKYVSRIAGWGIKQTHLLIAAQYLERLPPEALRPLAAEDVRGLQATDVPDPEIAKLIAGTLMLARMYFSNDGIGPPASEWRKVTSLPDHHAMLEIFSALRYDASVGEVGDRFDFGRPAAIDKTYGKLTFQPRGSEKRVHKETTAHAAKRSSPSEGARVQQPFAAPLRDASSPSIAHDVMASDKNEFEAALKQMATMSLETFERTYPDPISMVSKVELDRQPQLLLSILQTYVRAGVYPENPLNAAVRKLGDLWGHHGVNAEGRNKIVAAAIMLEINIPRRSRAYLATEIKKLVRRFGTAPRPSGIFSELRQQGEALRQAESYMQTREPAAQAAPDILVIDLCTIGRILECDPIVISEFKNAFVKGQTVESRQSALRAVEQQLEAIVEEKVAPLARRKVLAFIDGRVRNLSIGIDRFDDVFAAASPTPPANESSKKPKQRKAKEMFEPIRRMFKPAFWKTAVQRVKKGPGA